VGLGSAEGIEEVGRVAGAVCAAELRALKMAPELGRMRYLQVRFTRSELSSFILISNAVLSFG
jgi:hypothetical protein